MKLYKLLILIAIFAACAASGHFFPGFMDSVMGVGMILAGIAFICCIVIAVISELTTANATDTLESRVTIYTGGCLCLAYGSFLVASCNVIMIAVHYAKVEAGVELSGSMGGNILLFVMFTFVGYVVHTVFERRVQNLDDCAHYRASGEVIAKIEKALKCKFINS